MPSEKLLELTPENKESIKTCILQEYAPGDTPVVAAVSEYLINHHLSHREFGFNKGKELLQALPELFEFFYDPETNVARVRILSTPELATGGIFFFFLSQTAMLKRFITQSVAFSLKHHSFCVIILTISKLRRMASCLPIT